MNDRNRHLRRIDPSDLAGVWQRDERIAGERSGEVDPDECPDCFGSRIIGWNGNKDNPGFIACPTCKAAPTAADAARRLSRSGLTDAPKLAAMTFDAFNGDLHLPAGHVARCREYADAPSGWLLLIGPVGRGKSHLAAAIGNAVLARGGAVVFSEVTALLDSLRACYGNDQDETYDARFRRYRNAELLIIDDLGAEKVTEWSTPTLYQLINHRYNSGAATVITTNKALDKLDERIASRLSDRALVERLDFVGGVDVRNLTPAQRRGKAA